MPVYPDCVTDPRVVLNTPIFAYTYHPNAPRYPSFAYVSAKNNSYKEEEIMQIPPALIEQIREGNAILFLGAGASLGATTPDGEQTPDTVKLTVSLANRFLGGEDADKPLSVVAELAVSETDLTTVQQHIYGLFRDLRPTSYHRLVPSFRWSAIVTTNYDLLIEQAYQEYNKPLQTLVSFCKDSDRVDSKLRTTKAVPFMKLHGCISRLDDRSIPLILTIDQYVTHRKNRKKLFERVVHYASEYPLIFIGHSLEDPDVRQILLELSEESIARPRFFVVVPDVTGRQQRFWESKKISAINGTMQQFMEHLDSSLDVSLRAVSTPPKSHPLEARIVKRDERLSETTLELLSGEMTYVSVNLPSTVISPQDFYKGMSYGWAPIQQDLDSQRSLSDTILSDCILVDEVDRPLACDFYLIKGHAGSGKTICLKRIAWDAAVSFDRACLYYSGSNRISYDGLSEISDLIDERIFLFIDRPVQHVPDLSYIVRRARRESRKLTVICAERGNEWNVECRQLTVLLNESYDLRYLSSREIRALLKKLEDNKSLGLLASSSEPERLKAFEQKAGRQLLVALHEATMGKSFAAIVYDEFVSIEPEEARRIYLTICTLNRLEVLVRAGVVKRVHGISFEVFRKKFFQPLESIVHTLDYTPARDRAYQARHPWIAEVVFERAVTTPDERYDLYVRLLDALDVGYGVDRHAFRRLIRARELLVLFSDPRLVRNLYKKATEMAGEDAYVFQQQAIFEMRRDNPNFITAYDLLTQASKVAPHDKSITHTLAELEIERSRISVSAVEQGRHLTTAKQLARSLTSRDTDSSYGFHTLCKIGLGELENLLTAEPESDNAIGEAIKALESNLENGLQRFPDDEYLLEAESRLATLVRDDTRAMKSLQRAFRGNPTSPFVAKGLARLYELDGNSSDARSTLEECLEHRPGDKGVNAALGRILGENFPNEGMRAEYYWHRSFTSGDASYSNQFWYARQLYINGKHGEANDIFRQLRSARVSPYVRNKLRGVMNDSEGGPIRFRGRVERLESTYALVSVIDRRDWAFLHSRRVKRESWNEVALHAPLTFRLGFTYGGIAAFDIELGGW